MSVTGSKNKRDFNKDIKNLMDEQAIGEVFKTEDEIGEDAYNMYERKVLYDKLMRQAYNDELQELVAKCLRHKDIKDDDVFFMGFVLEHTNDGMPLKAALEREYLNFTKKELK